MPSLTLYMYVNLCVIYNIMTYIIILTILVPVIDNFLCSSEDMESMSQLKRPASGPYAKPWMKEQRFVSVQTLNLRNQEISKPVHDPKSKDVVDHGTYNLKSKDTVDQSTHNPKNTDFTDQSTFNLKSKDTVDKSIYNPKSKDIIESIHNPKSKDIVDQSTYNPKSRDIVDRSNAATNSKISSSKNRISSTLSKFEDLDASTRKLSLTDSNSSRFSPIVNESPKKSFDILPQGNKFLNGKTLNSVSKNKFSINDSPKLLSNGNRFNARSLLKPANVNRSPAKKNIQPKSSSDSPYKNLKNKKIRESNLKKPTIKKEDKDLLLKKLTPTEFRVTQEKVTER